MCFLLIINTSTVANIVLVGLWLANNTQSAKLQNISHSLLLKAKRSITIFK